MGRGGGLQNGRVGGGGGSENKGGRGRKRFHPSFFGIVLTQELEVLVILKGVLGHKTIPLFNMWA